MGIVRKRHFARVGDQGFEARISMKRFQVGVLFYRANIDSGNQTVVDGLSNEGEGSVTVSSQGRNAGEIVDALGRLRTIRAKHTALDIGYLAD